MIKTLEDFKREFLKIRSEGWKETHRKVPTGVGKTLEDLLGIPENNKQEPDFGVYELKSSRKDSGSMMTLITKSPSPNGANKCLLCSFGYISSAYENNKKVLHATLNANKFTKIADTQYSLKINYDNSRERISIYYKNEITKEVKDTGIFWDLNILKKKIESKIKNKIVHVIAESRDGIQAEEFKYENAYLLKEVSPENFFELLKNGKMFVDIRMGQYSNGKLHDHGTAFRIKDSDYHLVFDTGKIV